MDVYEKCSEYETKSFLLRLVRAEDAVDLLACYSDAAAVKFMNADRCTSDFYYRTLEEMRQCVAFWLRDYEQKAYVRFAVVARVSRRAVGTVEMFGGNGLPEYADWGMLRMDVASDFERVEPLAELVGLACSRFYSDFRVKNIVTKAIAAAEERRAAIRRFGFSDMAQSAVPFDRPREDYFIRQDMQARY